jgi:hypothetical protein
MNDKFPIWFKGDEEAVEFALNLWTAAQEWDDIEDEGKCHDHNALLAWLAFGKEYTPFFAKHHLILRPAMLFMYLQWNAANQLERGSVNDIHKAYMLRAGIYGVFHTIAWIVGDDEWATQVGPEIYREYAETIDSLVEEMT